MAKIITTDGEWRNIDNPTLKQLQEAVGGYIEEARTSAGRLMYINEEGTMPHMNLPPNATATHMCGRQIVGDVVLMETD